MRYQDEIKGKLKDYKKVKFPDLEDGIWKKSNATKPHILPFIHRFENLLTQYRTELITYLRKNKNIKLHQFFHHLNSSQAMCLNMFYPLIEEKKLDLLFDVLKIEKVSVDYDSVCFEKESDIEKAPIIEQGIDKRPTCFDFYFKTIDGKEFHFEIKYTEERFAKAEHDNSHEAKYEAIYKNHCSAINSEYCNCNSFLDNYQIMRNLIHVSNKSYVVFIYPENNKKIKQQAEDSKSFLVKSEFQQHVINLTWEDLLGYLDSINLDSEKLTTQMNDFKQKYCIAGNPRI
jgi:hypothetical protein